MLICHLFINLTKLFNIVGIIKLALLYLTGAQSYDMISGPVYVVSLVLSLSLSLFYHLYFYKNMRILESDGKKDTLFRLGKNHKWVPASSTSIRVGDIVKIGIHNICPADILIIDSTEQRMNGKIVLVNERKITGINSITRKWPLSDKFLPGLESQAKEIKNFLHGAIEYLDPSEPITDQVGYFKIKGDPKVKTITLENIVFTGSMLHTTGVTGMVLYTGRDTRIYQMNLKDRQFLGVRQHISTPISRYLTLITIFFLVLDFLGSYFLFLYFRKTGRSQTEILESEEPLFGRGLFGKYLECLAIVGSLIPIYLGIMKQLTMFIKGYFIQKRTTIELKTKSNRMSIVVPAEISMLRRKSFRLMGGLTEQQSLTPVQERKPLHERTPDALVDYELQEEVQISSLNKNIRRTVTGRERTRVISNMQSHNISLGDKDKSSIQGQESLKSTLAHNGPNNIMPSNEEHKQKPKKLETLLSYSSESYVHLSNFTSLSVLGRVDHVMLDKTETLTEANLELVYVSTWKHTYSINYETMSLVYEEFKKNPEAHKCEDSEEESPEFEDDFYSEKSQEFETELLGQYDEKLFGDDIALNKEVAKIRIPYYMPVPVEYVQNETMRADRSSPHHLVTAAADLEEDGRSSVTSGRNARITTKIEEIICRKGKLQVSEIQKLEQLMLFNKKGHSPTMLFSQHAELKDSKSENEDDQSLEEDHPQKLTARCSIIRTFHSFFYDTYTRAPEMERLLSTMASFLFCGMDEMKKTFTPSLVNQALSRFLKGLGIEVVFPKEARPLNKSGGYKPSEYGHALRIESDFGMVDHLQIYGVNPKNSLKPRTSIVLGKKQTASPYYFLLVRGEQSEMKGVMSMNDEESTAYRNLMAQYKDKRLSRIIYAYKKLTRAEVMQYVTQYAQIVRSKKYEIESINRVAIPLETNLKFLGAVGVKAKIRKDAQKLVDNLKAAYLRVSILSGDNYENTVNVLRELTLPPHNLSDQSSYFNIGFESMARAKSDLISYIEIVYHMLKSSNYQKLSLALGSNLRERDDDESAKEILQNLETVELDKSRVDNKFKRPMVLSGKSLALIQSDDDLMELFRILLVFTSSLIAHDLKPNQKSLLVKLVRCQHEVVMSVGDGLNDIGMFNESNVSVQLANGDISTFTGDIIVNKLDIVSHLVFSTGFNLFKNIKSAIFILIVFSTKLAAANAWAFGIDAFSVRLFDPYLIHLLSIIPLAECICLATLHKPYPTSFVSNNLAVYQEHQVFGARIALVTSLLFLGIMFELGIIFTVARIVFSVELFSGGLIGEQSEMSFFILSVLVLNCIFQDYLFWTTPQRIKIPVMIFSIIMYVILINIHLAAVISDPIQYFSLSDSFANKVKLTCYLTCVVVPTYFNYILISVVKSRALHPVQSVLDQLPSKAKQWKDHLDHSDPLIASYMRGYVQYFHTSEKLMEKVVNLVRPRISKKVDHVLLKLLLLNVYNFNLGFDHLSNKIIDMRDRLKFLIANTNSHEFFTKIAFTMQIIVYSFELFLKIVVLSSQVDNSWTVLYRHNNLYKISVYSGLLVLMWRKRPRDQQLQWLVLCSQLASIVIDCLVLLVDALSPSNTLISWHYIGANSRVVCSAIPLDFINSLLLLIGFELIAIYRIVFNLNPVDQRFSNPLYTGILVVNTFGIFMFLASMKKKYDKNTKINFLNVSRMKNDISRSKDKLAMLMPKFVWDKINTEGFSSKLLVPAYDRILSGSSVVSP